MGDPHNPQRYGETWSQDKIDWYLEELEIIRPYVIFSGGWAWHFMSPKGHDELKHAHDHKDVDIFVVPRQVATVAGVLIGRGFSKAHTKYDKLSNNYDFRRYEKVVLVGQPFRVTVDFFVRDDIRARDIDGWSVVEPEQLINFYSSIHSSGSCFAVTAASELLKRGIDPVGREELVAIPKDAA